MSLTEESFINSVTALRTGHLQVQRADVILRDGEEISRAYHRHVVAPGDDLSDQGPMVVTIALAVWTPEVLAAHAAAVAAATAAIAAAEAASTQ